MKKILSVATLSMLMCALSFSLNSTKATTNEMPFEEYAHDVFENESNKRILKAVNINDDEEVDISKVFIQSGSYVKDEIEYHALRFAVAIKGDVESIQFTRGLVDGVEGTQTKDVTSVYRGISSGENIVYYNPEDPEANELGLTTNVEYASTYYWACYTVSFPNDQFKFSNIPLELKVNGVDYEGRKASLAEAQFGTHTHDYSKLSHTNTRHFNVCLLCETIDELSFENHKFVKFNKDYYVGDTFSIDDVTLGNNCDCGHEFADTSLLTISKYPESTLKLCDTLTVNNNGFEEEISIPVYENFLTNWNNRWSYTQGLKDSKVNCAYKEDLDSFKVHRADEKASWGGIKNNDFKAPSRDFDFIFRLRVAAGKLNLKVRCESYCVNIAFDLDENGNRYIAKDYDIDNEYVRSKPFDASTWHTYKVSVRKMNNGEFVFSVYIDDQREPLLANIAATTGGSDLLLIAVGEKLKAGTNNNTETYIEYLTFNLK